MQFKLTFLGTKVSYNQIKIENVSGWENYMEFNYGDLPIFLLKVLSQLYEEEETDNETQLVK